MNLRKGSKEEWVFNLLKLSANPETNIVNYNPFDSGNTDKFYKGFAILKNQGHVAKILSGRYLINPNSLKPYPPYYKKVLAHWLELTNKNH